MFGESERTLQDLETRCVRATTIRIMYCKLRQNRFGTKNIEKKAEDPAKEKESKERAWTRKVGLKSCVRDIGCVIMLTNIHPPS